MFQAPSWSMFLISMCHKTFDPYSCLSTMCSKPLTIREIYTSDLRETLILCRFHIRPYIVRGSLHIALKHKIFFRLFLLKLPHYFSLLTFLILFIYLFNFSFQQKEKKKKKMNILRLGHHEGHIYLGNFLISY